MSSLPQHFKDGIRTVDFVLVYRHDEKDPVKLKKRKIFETNLENEGLELERDTTQSLHFLQIYVPLEVLYEYGEILKIKIPLKKIPGEDEIVGRKPYKRFSIKMLSYHFIQKVIFNPFKSPRHDTRIHIAFSRNYQELYDSEDPNFFDPATRIAIIYFILERQHFEPEGEETPDNLGLEKLLEDGVYTSAYPVHVDSDRKLLLDEWALLRKFFHMQPLDNIKRYFGAKVALYFAWLGFYIHMLIPLSFIGLLCLLYSYLTWPYDPLSKECYDMKSVIMCPQCDRKCDYWNLGDSCSSIEWNYLIDNNATIVFAISIALWSVLYLELWNRYSSKLVHRWGLIGFTPDIEHPRIKYLNKIRAAGLMGTGNSVLEPDVSFLKVKFFPYFISFGITLIFISISMIAMTSLIIYRMALKTSDHILGVGDSTFFLRVHFDRLMLNPLVAGIVDLIVITLLDSVYSRLAKYLTNLEYCRTQTEFDESLAVKTFLFQFVNFYTSIFFIVFLKGKFIGYPAEYKRVFGFRQDECRPGGCLYELSMQLTIIMCGRQAKAILSELVRPHQVQTLKNYEIEPNSQWTDDYYLKTWTTSSLFGEYLKMVIQYGFMTLFGLAFPLAPLVALVANIFKLRLDATKILRFHHRVIGQRASTIGVWYNIVTILTKIAVFTSSVVIAFSSNIIPKLVYRLKTNGTTLDGYLNFTLAYIDTKDLEVKPEVPNTKYTNVTSCRYHGFRNPPWHEYPYKLQSLYWEILTARLLFIVIFQNLVGCLQALVAYSIPHISRRLRKRIIRENFLAQQYILEFVKRKEIQKRLAAKSKLSE